MSNIISLVKPIPPEPTKPVNFTHDDAIVLMMALEMFGALEGYEGLDARIYPQLQRIHSEFIGEFDE